MRSLSHIHSRAFAILAPRPPNSVLHSHMDSPLSPLRTPSILSRKRAIGGRTTHAIVSASIPSCVTKIVVIYIRSCFYQSRAHKTQRGFDNHANPRLHLLPSASPSIKDEMKIQEMGKVLAGTRRRAPPRASTFLRATGRIGLVKQKFLESSSDNREQLPTRQTDRG